MAKSLARKLRKNSTNAEKIFWEAVRDRRFCGKKFYRQKVIFFNHYGTQRFFIADFYCHELKVVIELDGGVHKQQKEYDEIRSEIINSKGIKVIRFNNEEIEENINLVLINLKKTIQI